MFDDDGDKCFGLVGSFECSIGKESTNNIITLNIFLGLTLS